MYKRTKEVFRGYAFHIHGDYLPEWIKCVEVAKRDGKFLARTALLPNCKSLKEDVATQVIQRNFLLLSKDPDLK